MKKLATLAALMMAVAVLDGCSAGGTQGNKAGSPTPTPTPTPTPAPAVPTMTLALSESSVSSSSPATISAMVLDATGNAVAGAVVNFAVSSTVGKLTSPATLTNTAGVATDTLSPATGSTAASADTVTATASVAGTALTATAGYQTSITGATFSSFTAPNLTGALTAYNQTTLSLQMAGVSAAAPVALTITSDCVGAGKATITPASTVTTTGVVTFVYQDKGGCGATLSTDNVTVTAVGATPPSKTFQLALASPPATSVSFISSATNPSNNPIFLKGATGPQSSTVTFTVVDIAGNPLPNQPVTLDLTTYAGGLLIDGGSVPVTKNSDSLGHVSVIVTAGTVPTPVSVNAVLGNSINGTTSTVSSLLAIGTGIPTQSAFSFEPSILNIQGFDPLDNEAWDGFTIATVDRSGNPISGVAVSMWAEAGQIPSSVDTILSADNLSSTLVSYSSIPVATPPDGHVTLLAYAIGEESFNDLNHNNVWDEGEPFQDLGDPFRDRYYDGIFSTAKGDESFSLNASGVGGTQACAVTPGFVTDVTVPMVPNTCDGTWSNQVYVRRSKEIVLTTAISRAVWPSPSGLDSTTCSNLAITRQVGPAPNPTLTAYSASESTWHVVKPVDQVVLIVEDNNAVRFNPVAAGTTITATAGPGMNSASIGSGSPVISTLTPTGFAVKYDLGTSTTGEIDLAITSPGKPLQPSGIGHGSQTTTTMRFFLTTAANANPPTSTTCPQ